MKKILLLVILTCIMPMNNLFGQSFDALWTEESDALLKDLPETQLKVLQTIEKKALKEQAYGHLLKARLKQARVQAMISPDSLKPAVERLQQQAEATNDAALKAVYYAVLGKIFKSNSSLDDNWRSMANDYFRKAMEHPAELAAVKDDVYKPFVVKTKDSRIYDEDLLSLIGHETRQYQPMYDYYMTTGNRRAQLMSKLYLLQTEEPEGSMPLKDCAYVGRLDSLANAYADLPECGEVAIVRYMFMDSQTDATAAQKEAYIDEAISRWGAWERMNVLRNARRDLTARQFYAELEHKVWIPNQEQRLRLYGLRGIDQLTVKLYKVKVDGNTTLDPNDNFDYEELTPLLKPMPELTMTRTYSGKKDYELYCDTLQMSQLPVGVYMMETETQPETSVSRALFFVSDVRVLVEPLPGNKMRYVAVNATTGMPIAGAKLCLATHYSFSEDDIIDTLTTDANGEYLYTYEEVQRPVCVYATTDTDRACPIMNANDKFHIYDWLRSFDRTDIYTDRAIYRPGQTVHMAAICYTSDNGYEHKVCAGEKVIAVLRDANRKIVDEKELTTDDFGTVSTDFVLPASGLTGLFRVEVDKTAISIRVEEYKRPTFQVEFPKVEQDYKDGDTLTVRASARTYSGVPVQGATVKYKVMRNMAFWWLSYSRYWQEAYLGAGEHNQEVFSGETTTADDGTFEVRMPMVLPQSLHPQFYNFVVKADVTDLGGETHQGQLSLPLGNRNGVIVADLPEKVLAEDMTKMKLHMLNAAGNDVNATLRYQIDGGKWLTAPSNTPIELPRLKSGKHELKVEYEDKKHEQEFVVFSLQDKRPATETDDWFYVSAKQFPNDGKPVSIQVGSSKQVHIVYSIVAGNDIIEQGAIDRNNELINRKLTYKPEYGNGLSISYAWVRDGKTYTHSMQIRRPLPDKQLTMKWETFRDRLKPGQQEEWTLSVQYPTNKAQGSMPQTQLLATLYDKSLDQISEPSGNQRVWKLEPRIWLPMGTLLWHFEEWGKTQCDGYQHEGHLYEKDLSFSHFNEDCFPYPWLSRPRLLYKSTLSRAGRVESAPLLFSAGPIKEVTVASQTATDNSMNASVDKALKGRIAGLDIENAEPEVQIRENLQETAFFYPQLLADSTGRVSLKFTLPESLTTWRFLGIAHTKDMMHGFIDGETVAQKDVMIQPNMPRFLRVGDEGIVSARIFNMTDRELNGTAQLQLLDPESNQIVWTKQTTCLLGANATVAVSFPVDASKLEAYSLLICKMSVSGESFSDGEQHYLPILPNRERVTVTMPFTQNEPGTKVIDLTEMIPADAQQAKLTVEYTNNPAWLMIQALPTLSHPRDDNAISQAASLYANLLGQHIISQNPNAKTVFDLWSREQGNETSLQSNLAKNEELKDLLLTETPWVLDAEHESEQKRLLCGFFDTNTMQQRITSAAEKLGKLQASDGAWSWWPGMRGSVYMTIGISEMLVRLNQMAGPQKETKTMLDGAFRFMGKEMVKMVNEMKKQEKKGVRQHFPSHMALEWLYICALDGRTLPANVQKANSYLKNLLKKDIKKQTIYEKAMSAIVLNSPQYIQSLKEWTVYKEEMGRYYDSPRASYSWRSYRIPTQVAAIEALQRLTPNDRQTIEEMQRWLLQEKRTTCWDTPLNSVDAVYAFLNGNAQALAPQPKTVLSMDGQPLDSSEATAGIGYTKTTLPVAKAGTFKAEKQSTGTSWGAVYAQFMQKTGNISHQASGISLKRELFMAGASTSLPAQHSPLKVGDRIKIRITIEADRDYDFVQVTDKRAACLEPVQQLSGYRHGYYCTPKDNTTNYFFDMLPKGKHVIETEYYIDREGHYETGTCSATCAYSPEFRGLTKSQTITVTEKKQ